MRLWEKIKSTPNKFLYLSVLFSLTLLITLTFSIGLTEQEAYYWTWSKNLSWSYFDHPPLHAWVLSLFTSIFGDSIWVVRLVPFLCHLTTLGLVTKICREKFTAKDYFIPAIFINSTIFLIHILFSVPDSLFAPLCLFAFYFSEHKKVALTGFFWGLALLAKWPAVLLFPVLAFNLFEGVWSRHYIATIFGMGLLAALIQFPVFYWNYENHWMSFYFHLLQRHHKEGLTFNSYILNAVNFVALQFFILGPVFIMALFFGWKNREKLNQRIVKQTVLWCAPILVVFGASAVHSESRFYWTVIVVIPISFFIYDAYLAMNAGLKRRLLLTMAFYGVLISSLIFTSLAFPVGGILRSTIEASGIIYDYRMSPRGDFYGWGQWVQKIKSEMKIDLAQTIIIVPDFHIAAKLKWALKDPHGVSVYTMSNPHEYRFIEKTDFTKRKNFLFVEDNRYKFDSSFETYCDTIDKKGSDFPLLLGYEVKKIEWAHCLKLKPLVVDNRGF